MLGFPNPCDEDKLTAWAGYLCDKLTPSMITLYEQYRLTSPGPAQSSLAQRHTRAESGVAGICRLAK